MSSSSIITTVLMEQIFFPGFPLFFRLQEEQETLPKFGNLTKGKIFGTLLRVPIF